MILKGLKSKTWIIFPLLYLLVSISAVGHDTNINSLFETQSSKKPCISLTFDDGPDPATTPQVLKILTQHHIQATFFVVGKMVQKYPSILKDIYKSGQAIGNHSWSHPFMARLDRQKQLKQIEKTNTIIHQILPHYQIHFFRAPYGSVNQSLRNLLDQKKMILIWWNVDDEDYKGFKPQKLKTIVMSETQKGSIILMHDIHSNTVYALNGEIQALQQAGYRFCSLGHLIFQWQAQHPLWSTQTHLYGYHHPLFETPSIPLVVAKRK